LDKQNPGKLSTNSIVLRFVVSGLLFERMSPILAGKRGRNEQKEIEKMKVVWNQKAKRKGMVYRINRCRVD